MQKDKKTRILGKVWFTFVTCEVNDFTITGIKYALKYAGEKERTRNKGKTSLDFAIPYFGLLDYSIAYRSRKRGQSELVKNVKQGLERVGNVVDHSIQMANPLKFWMNVLNPSPGSSRKQSKSRSKKKKSKSKGSLDYAYRKKKWGRGQYRTIDDDALLMQVKSTVDDITENEEPKYIGDPRYFDTFKKNKDFIEEESKAAGVNEATDDEIKKSIDENFDKGFGSIYDKIQKPWGEIHKPQILSKMGDYGKEDDYYVYYDEYHPYYDNKYW